MIYVYRSNRLEALADLFCRDIERGGDSIFENAFTVVQSQGMARWLTLYQAKNRRIAFNPSYFYPRNAILSLMKAIWDDDPQDTFPDREDTVWPIFQLLSEMKSLAGFESVAAYLNDQDALKQLQLSMELAGLFDDYLIYRFDWIQQWTQANGGQLPWQGQLFRALWQRLGQPSHLALKVDESKRPLPESAKLPRKIRLFGLTTLPPLYLEFLNWISKKIPVDLYLLQPGEGYWGDVLSAKQRARLNENEEEEVYVGHPLLGSMGMQGRDLLNLLIDIGAEFTEQDVFERPQGSLLQSLQADLFDLDEGMDAPESFWPVDSSIQVHNCHNPMREVEVLKDALLQAFEEDPDLKPEEILVLTTDIEAYAPYVHAVFGTEENHIPYSLADQAPRAESELIDTFFHTLELVETPHTTTAIYEWLKQPSIARKYDFSESDYSLMKRWIQKAGIRWGRDAPHRQSVSGISFEQNTWFYGLKKLLLGVAMQGDGSELYEDTLPYPDMEGQAVALLGRLLDALEWLFNLTLSFDRPRSLRQWRQDLLLAIRSLWDDEEADLSARNALEECLTHLGEPSDVAGVDIRSLRYFLNRTLESHYQSGSFLQGKISFASLKPLRSVPAKIICLLGMDFDGFPTVDRPYEFNEMAKSPRLGDRRGRDSDRYLFLETLLSARNHLFISYVGQSARDNKSRPPSVLVSELLDYLHAKMGFAEAKDSPLCITHKLYPFHPNYFESDTRFSYSSSAETIARHYRQLLNGEAPAISSSPHTLDGIHLESGWPESSLCLDDLVSFFKNPLKGFLTRTAKLKFPRDDDDALEELEPFALDNLQTYQAKTQVLQERLEGIESENIQRVFQANGCLPLGGHGSALFQDINDTVKPLLKALEECQESGEKGDLSRVLDLGPWRYAFAFDHVYGSKVVSFRPAKAKPKDYLAAWISHLSLLAAGESGLDFVCLTEDKRICFDRSLDAESLLNDLIGAFYQGHQKPFFFFPDSSKAYIDQKRALVSNSRASATAESKAQIKWNGVKKRGSPGEKDDLYNDFYFRDFSPWDDPEWLKNLDSVAERIWTPLLNALCEEALS